MRTPGHYFYRIGLIMLTIFMFIGLGSCGTTRAHFGLDHDIAYNWNGGYYEDAPYYRHHKKPKPPKHKKHKKAYRHKKQHHHHDD